MTGATMTSRFEGRWAYVRQCQRTGKRVLRWVAPDRKLIVSICDDPPLLLPLDAVAPDWKRYVRVA